MTLPSPRTKNNLRCIVLITIVPGDTGSQKSTISVAEPMSWESHHIDEQRDDYKEIKAQNLIHPWSNRYEPGWII